MIPPEQLRLEPEQSKQLGGQHVGVSPSGVWATHVPTGLKAFCNCERSQLRNRNIAVAMLEYGLAEMNINPEAK